MSIWYRLQMWQIMMDNIPTDLPSHYMTVCGSEVHGYSHGKILYFKLSEPVSKIPVFIPYSSSQTLRKALDNSGLSHVEIVGTDSGWGIASDMLKDKELNDSISIIG